MDKARAISILILWWMAKGLIPEPVRSTIKLKSGDGGFVKSEIGS